MSTVLAAVEDATCLGGTGRDPSKRPRSFTLRRYGKSWARHRGKLVLVNRIVTAWLIGIGAKVEELAMVAAAAVEVREDKEDDAVDI
jgi:hypothetical protein